MLKLSTRNKRLWGGFLVKVGFAKNLTTPYGSFLPRPLFSRSGYLKPVL